LPEGAAVIELRPYQHAFVHAILVSKGRRKLAVMPTGGGKTLIAAQLIREAEKDLVLFLAHRRELIHQARDKLAEFDIRAGVILAGKTTDPTAKVQIASIQTLWSRHKREAGWIPQAGLVFIDEAHRATAFTYRSLISKYPDATVVGLTATPCRSDGRGLGSAFDTMIESAKVQDLIDRGHLVRTKVYAPTTPDLTGVQIRCGDYAKNQLAERMIHPRLVGEIVTHWHRLAERRKTVVFASSVEHSIFICGEFQKSGVKAEHIDGKTPKEDRDRILKRLSDGDLELVTNCMVLTEGWDQPDVSCCVLARPTMHMGLYRQMIGRVLRPWPGKEFALVLDHAGAVFQHGFVEDAVEWTLDPDLRPEAPLHEARAASFGNRLVTCSNCSAIRTAGKPCFECGHMPKRPGQYHAVINADLAERDRLGSLPNEISQAERQQFYRGLIHLALERGNRIGAAAHRYKYRFKQWPPRHWNALGPTDPTAEVIAWDRHCRIRYAKSMQKAQTDA
jgi:superfamily II DNA or RNA helicase